MTMHHKKMVPAMIAAIAANSALLYGARARPHSDTQLRNTGLTVNDRATRTHQTSFPVAYGKKAGERYLRQQAALRHKKHKNFSDETCPLCILP